MGKVEGLGKFRIFHQHRFPEEKQPTGAWCITRLYINDAFLGWKYANKGGARVWSSAYFSRIFIPPGSVQIFPIYNCLPFPEYHPRVCPLDGNRSKEKAENNMHAPIEFQREPEE